MARKPLTFGIRLRDKGRTLRVKQDTGKRGYVVEDSSEGKSKKRSHDSLGGALRDAATAWRSRLH